MGEHSSRPPKAATPSPRSCSRSGLKVDEHWGAATNASVTGKHRGRRGPGAKRGFGGREEPERCRRREIYGTASLGRFPGGGWGAAAAGGRQEGRRGGGREGFGRGAKRFWRGDGCGGFIIIIIFFTTATYPVTVVVVEIYGDW